MAKKTKTIKPTTQEELLYQKQWKDSGFIAFARRYSQNKVAVAGVIVIILMILMAIFAPLLMPYDYSKVDPIHANQTPSAAHWFGTDSFGRDILSRIIYGSRFSLTIGLSASLLGSMLGVVFGLIAGFFGKWIETGIMRFFDILQSIPNILLCIVISVAMGPGVLPTIVALSIGSIPMIGRLLRATMLSVRELEFIEAAKAINCSKTRIMVRHILPNCLAPLIVTFTTSTGFKIMSLAGLSFIGLGIQEPSPEWGAMISGGRAFLRYYPHLVFFPGIFIVLLVLSFNMAGDGLRDTLDPKLRR